MHFFIIFASEALLAQQHDETLEKVILCRRKVRRAWRTSRASYPNSASFVVVGRRWKVPGVDMKQDYNLSVDLCLVNSMPLLVQFVEFLWKLRRCDRYQASCWPSTVIWRRFGAIPDLGNLQSFVLLRPLTWTSPTVAVNPFLSNVKIRSKEGSLLLRKRSDEYTLRRRDCWWSVNLCGAQFTSCFFFF